MKKIIKKVVSCILSFVFILTPLMFTGCMDVITNLLLEEYLNNESNNLDDVEPTYYIGSLYSNDDCIGWESLITYIEGWEKRSEMALDAFYSEFGIGTSGKNTLGNREIDDSYQYGIEGEVVAGRTGYFPDYKTLFKNDVLDDEDAKKIFCNTLYYSTTQFYYTVENDYFVYALLSNGYVSSDGDGRMLATTDGDQYKIDPRIFDVVDNKFVSKVLIDTDYYTNSISCYTNNDGKTHANICLSGAVLFDMSTEKDYKVFGISAQSKKSTTGDTGIVVIGEKSTFKKTFGGSTFFGSLINFTKKIYDTNYGLAKYYWDPDDCIRDNVTSDYSYICYPNFFRKTQGGLSHLMQYEENNADVYYLAANTIKGLLVNDEADVELLKECIPTSISLTNINLAETSLVDIKSSQVQGSNKSITAISLYDIYNAMISGNCEIQDENSKEKIVIKKDSKTSGYCNLFKFFVLCSYQFFNGICGVPSEDDMEIVADFIMNDANIYKLGEDYTSTFKKYITDYVTVKTAKSGNVKLKPMAYYMLNQSQDVTMGGDNFGCTLEYTSGLVIEQGPDCVGYKEFFSDETRKYYSLAFEAWGEDYEMYGIIFQIDYLTEEEKTAGETSNNWEMIRDHYTIVIERCIYDKNKKGMQSTHLMSIKASELFSDGEIEEGYFFINFEDLTSRIGEETIETLQLNSLLSAQKVEEYGGARSKTDVPFAYNENSGYRNQLKKCNVKGGYASMAYSQSSCSLQGEEYIQLIFAVDNEAYRIPFRITEIGL
jgi:hypothetical protein